LLIIVVNIISHTFSAAFQLKSFDLIEMGDCC